MQQDQTSRDRRYSELISGPLTRSPAPIIGVIDGEGIGPQLIELSLGVLAAVQEVTGSSIEVRRAAPIEGDPDADRIPQQIHDFSREVLDAGGALFAGPVGGRFVYNFRRELDLFCKLVPLTVYPELVGASRLKPEHLADVDVLVVRDNAAGAYQGSCELQGCAPERVAQHSFSYTEQTVCRLLEVAAGMAALRRGRLSVVVKPGGLPAMSELWSDCALAAAEAAQVRCEIVHADHAVYCVVQHPQELDVVAAPNVFGDVLSDIGAVLLGSRGLSFGASYGTRPGAYYQTNHGSAHDLVGQDLANPAGQFLSLAMLLRESFGLFDAADLVERALRAVWHEGWRTADLVELGCRQVGTDRLGELVVDKIRSLGRS